MPDYTAEEIRRPESRGEKGSFQRNGKPQGFPKRLKEIYHYSRKAALV